MPAHKDRRRRPGPAGAVICAVVVAGLVAGGAAVGLGRGDASGCDRTLRVAAAPAIAPVIASIARSMPGAGSCPRVTVSAVSPQDVVLDLADGSIRPPDVWVPDSSLWLTRATKDRVASVADAPSVASSPLVLAMTRTTARALSPGGRPTLADLVRSTTAGRPFTLELSNQHLSPQRVGAVVALSAATASRPDPRAAVASVLRTTRFSDRAATSPLVALDSTQPVAVPVAEQTLVAAHRHDLVAVYPGTVTFDYPFAVLSGHRATVSLADRLLARLRGHVGQDAMRAAGLRDVSGHAAPTVSGSTSLDRATIRPPRPLTRSSLTLAERTLDAVKRDARLLAVLDASGSMGWGMAGPDTGGPSRLRLATAAARRGMSLYPDTTQVGLWLFPGTEQGQDIQRAAAVAELGDVRQNLAATLSSTQAVPGGDTPLYAATLAAVREMRRGWDPDKVNAVVLLSDGHDTGGGPSLDGLLDALHRMRTSDRPVPVITIAFGPDSDAQALAAISEASGGSTYRANAGTAISQVFLDALGQRVCRPDCGAGSRLGSATNRPIH